MKKKRRRFFTRNKKRIIKEFFNPLIQGFKDSIELVMVCIILSMFRLVLTGESFLTKLYLLEFATIIFFLIAISISETYVIKEESLFDIIFAKMFKIIKFLLSALLIFIVVLM